MPRTIPQTSIKAILAREDAHLTRHNPNSSKLANAEAKNWRRGCHVNRFFNVSGHCIAELKT